MKWLTRGNVPFLLIALFGFLVALWAIFGPAIREAVR